MRRLVMASSCKLNIYFAIFFATMALVMVMMTSATDIATSNAEGEGSMTATATPKSVLIYVGKAVAFLCKASGSQQPITYQWFKIARFGNLIPLGQTNSRTGLLSILNMTQAHLGKYVCNATGPKQTVRTTVEIRAPEKPEIIVPGKFVLRHGEVKQITCEVLASEHIDGLVWSSDLKQKLSKYHMLRNSDVILQGNKATSTLTLGNEQLYTPEMCKEVTGNYSCSVIVRGIKYSQTFYIQVEGETVILWFPYTMHWEIGSNHMLECSAMGIPRPTVTWFHGDRLLSPDTDSDVEILNVDQTVYSSLTALKFSNFSRDMIGNYSCRAENVYNYAIRTVNILRTGPPGPPTISVQNVDKTKFRLLLEPSEDDGDAPVAFYNVAYHAFPLGSLSTVRVMASQRGNTYARDLAELLRVRLSRKNRNYGRVEIYDPMHERWLAICDSDWDIDDARVACRMLGYSNAERASRGSKYGQLDKMIWNHVRCDGHEITLFNCSRENAQRSNTCRGWNTAGMVCAGPKTEILAMETNSVVLKRILPDQALYISVRGVSNLGEGFISELLLDYKKNDEE